MHFKVIFNCIHQGLDFPLGPLVQQVLHQLEEAFPLVPNRQVLPPEHQLHPGSVDLGAIQARPKQALVQVSTLVGLLRNVRLFSYCFFFHSSTSAYRDRMSKCMVCSEVCLRSIKCAILVEWLHCISKPGLDTEKVNLFLF